MPTKLERYPDLGIRSKNELAKRLASKKLPYAKSLELINDVLSNFEKYWSDHPVQSEPEKGKYVRNAAGSNLGRLLKLIDTKVLAPNDALIPGFLFGGLSKRSHIQAAQHLLGTKRARTLQSIDIHGFYEQISQERVQYFFYKKAGCSRAASLLLARLCCVPKGPKGCPTDGPVLARGFATSSRLALWCNLDTFLRLKWTAVEELRTHDPRVAIYVDDIGITASRVSEDRMKEVAAKLVQILALYDPNQKLPVQEKKVKTSSYKNGMQILGIVLGRNKLTMGTKSRKKRDVVLRDLKTATPGRSKRDLLKKKRAYRIYEHQLKKSKSV